MHVFFPFKYQHAQMCICEGVREIGVIERYGAVISTLDGSLEPREGDDFLGWLRSQSFDNVGSSSSSSSPQSAPRGGSGAEDEIQQNSATAIDSSSEGSGGDSGTGTGSRGDGAMQGAAQKRAELEAFLSAASARLNALVASKEEALFGDRGEEQEDTSVEGKGGGVQQEKGATAATVISPNMSDEDLYQVCLRTW